MSREELIAALEKATGPDRRADFWCWWWGKAQHDGDLPDADYAAVNIARADSPRYTASIDAALTLVPEGWRWSLDWTQRPPYQDCGRADLYAPGNGIKPPDVYDVYAATPALALCIAALKAHAT